MSQIPQRAWNCPRNRGELPYYLGFLISINDDNSLSFFSSCIGILTQKHFFSL